MKRRIWGLWLLLLGLCCLTACIPKPTHIKGNTMGTTYTVVLPHLPLDMRKEQLQQAIESILKQVNDVMSTYQADSELSLLNQNPSTDWLPVSAELMTVLKEAQRISQLSEGAFDASVGPLVNLWGFGPEYHDLVVPDPQKVAEVRAYVGYDKLALRDEPLAVKKAHPKMAVDLSAIAKGYGVDQVAAYLEQSGVKHYLVDIGGELRTRGRNVRGEAWTVAIEKPIPEGRFVQQLIHASDTGVATSGDYRNYFEQDGKRYSHTIDPTTGAPITHNLASVTVLHLSAMTADGLATALTVLGPERGLALAEQQKWPVLMLVKTEDGFSQQMTSAFAPFILQRAH